MACSTSAIKQTRSTDQVIEKVNFLAVRFFRPDYPVAAPDDFSHADRELHCETPSNLWADLFTPEKTSALIACVNSLSAPAHYLYIPQTKPALDIDPVRRTPPNCLYPLLPSLPLPREIYFLGKTVAKTDQDVYGMSLDTKATQIADTQLRARYEIELQFPLFQKLRNAQDLNLWLTVIVFQLFKNKGPIQASLVTEEMANRCFASDPLFGDKKSGKIPGVFWP